MFLGTSEELSGTFGLGRDVYGGTCVMVIVGH